MNHFDCHAERSRSTNYLNPKQILNSNDQMFETKQTPLSESVWNFVLGAGDLVSDLGI